MDVKIRPWFPVVSRCPLSRFPDITWISIYTDSFIELHAARKQIRKSVFWKKMFMEDLAKMILSEFPEAYACNVQLVTGAHSVTVYKDDL